MKVHALFKEHMVKKMLKFNVNVLVRKMKFILVLELTSVR